MKRPLSVVVAALALSLGLTLPTSAEAQPRPTSKRPLKKRHKRPAKVDKRMALALQVAKTFNLPRAIKTAERRQLENISRLLARGKQAQAKAQWQQFAKKHFNRRNKANRESIQRWVLHKAFLAPPAAPGAKPAAVYRPRKGQARAYRGGIGPLVAFLHHRQVALEGLRQCRVTNRAALRKFKKRGARLRTCTVTIAPHQAGRLPSARPGSALRDKNALEAYIHKLEAELQTVGDDASLANIDLQNALQKQQQLLQTMSNVSKMMHDTLMAIIRNLR